MTEIRHVPPRAEPAPSRPAVPALLDRAAAYSWRLLVVGAAAVALLTLVGRLRLVLIPLVITVLVARVLAAPCRWLRDRRWPPGAAAGAAVVGFLALLVAGFWVLGALVADEVGELGPTLGEAVDDVEQWLVEDSPFDVSRSELERYRRDLGDAARSALGSSGGAVLSGAIAVVEAVVGVVLGLIITFFALKDGDRFLAVARRLVPPGRREVAAVMAGRAWDTLGGYLRGAALLGVVEGTAIGIALWVVGAGLALAVAMLTFLAAFVPFVGAIVAGVVAVLVALATAGLDAALIVAVVAVAVQQFDNDLLAPVVYGRALNLHPVAVLLAITAGAALFGLAGSILAIPVTAVVANVVAAARDHGAGDDGHEGEAREAPPAAPG
ncbi:MAG TPA: AI-2E family transporter [Acidimicrobiales bacterium]|nr:AI-2E family transporter [Acidimicrobiales bacterium]